ncbi:MAG: UDP-N-acetylmuramoyl-L-alanyl-D-glutamate--2,6-diaminopimelate ligase [Pseudomonadota bacterium]|nr:UDP-N-acetylmuramoyl-L-alanyl-D-glutamate--2,6-diaminopimelate ligase [Pseudomonadota bacterium]
MPALQPVRSLRGLTAGLLEIPPERDLDIDGLTLDSRRAGPGKLFLALPGSSADGRDFISRAILKGAAAVLYQSGDGFQAPAASAPLYAVPGLRREVSRLAARFFGRPSEALLVIGVTGTNGKTTCAHLIAQALERLDTRCGVLGTLGCGFPDDLQDAGLTTPDAIELQRQLTELVGEDAEAICMEVSSHGLDQERADAVVFDIAVFTNLSRDHLDYHGDLQSYGKAKARLFDFPSLQHAVINSDDPFGARLAQKLSGRSDVRLWTYGLESGEIRPDETVIDEEGIRLTLPLAGGGIEFRAPLVGRINAPNLLAVIATLLACGHGAQAVAGVLPALKPPPGRMELFQGMPAQPAVVVDYAHTPDALERALTSLREHTAGRLWVVFGCGGDRDRGKRPQMGAIAERLADKVILTDDNPRGEEPAAIVADIARGMERKAEIVHDRRQAIADAIRRAATTDMVLVAGKGHEATQTASGRSVTFSDREVVKNLLGGAS